MPQWVYSSQRGWIVVDPSQSTIKCPLCDADANRVPRRTVDRLISRIFPRHRYQCRSQNCRWEGNFPVGREEH